MTYYQVSLRGRPVAIVKTIDLARTIVRCRRHGYYAIKMVESGEDIPSGAKLHQKSSVPKREGKRTSNSVRSRTSKSATKAPSRKPSKSR
jgi:hypothetical protein